MEALQLINMNGLCNLMGINYYTLRCLMAHPGFPKALNIEGSKRRLWSKTEILRWLAGQENRRQNSENKTDPNAADGADTAA